MSLYELRSLWWALNSSICYHILKHFVSSQIQFCYFNNIKIFWKIMSLCRLLHLTIKQHHFLSLSLSRSPECSSRQCNQLLWFSLNKKKQCRVVPPIRSAVLSLLSNTRHSHNCFWRKKSRLFNKRLFHLKVQCRIWRQFWMVVFIRCRIYQVYNAIVF